MTKEVAITRADRVYSRLESKTTLEDGVVEGTLVVYEMTTAGKDIEVFRQNVRLP